MELGTLPVTLITGLPGVGKSALMVKLLQEAQAEGRPLFVNGIPELKLDHSPVPPLAEWTERRIDEATGQEMAYFTFPENALVCSDEAQRIFRPRTQGSKVPDHVAAFETIRHTGITFICGTQDPSFIDSHVRKLVGCHVHLRDVGVLGRRYYEWPEATDIGKYATAPIKKKFKVPKAVFKLYKSSSKHIKRQYNVPPVMILFLVCLLLLAGGAYRMYSSMAEKMQPQLAEVVPAETGKIVPAGFSSSSPGVKSEDPAEYLASFMPVVPGLPESAPAYSHLRAVKDMPRLVGGVCSETRCVCYTQQGTDAGIDSYQCREWLANPRFDPYAEPQPVAVPVPQMQSVTLQESIVPVSPVSQKEKML